MEKLTKELCKEKALLCIKRSEFKRRYNREYKYCLKNKLMDDICSHMSLPNCWLTIDSVHKEALKYEYRADFQKYSNPAYLRAYRQNWLDIVCSHMKKYPFLWTNKETVIKEALKYEFKKDFIKNGRGAYDSALANDWLKEIIHFKKIRKDKDHWKDIENIKEEALKYNGKFEFQKKSSGAYRQALINGWLDEVCSHMETCGNKYHRFVYTFTFDDNSIYVGLTCNIKKRYNNHFSNKSSQIYKKYQTNTNFKFEVISDLLTATDAKKSEIETIEYYKNQGYTILNKTKGGEVGGSDELVFSLDYRKNETSKYLRKKDLEKNNRQLYTYIHKNNLMTETCSHMLNIKDFNKKNILEEASKYNNIEEFKKNSKNMYNNAIRNGYIDEIYENYGNINIPKYSETSIKKRIKLSENDVIEIFYDKSNIKTILEKYQITKTTVYEIKNKKTWKKLTEKL